ncbi:MAG: T9SS type A sorting domain-containing protein [Vicingus serpentipes]|nr:T9SS type A sorting domain-containing protein [Vicingus serpentipes]
MGWVKTTYNHTTYSKNWSMLDFDRSEYFNVYVHGDGRAAFSTCGSGVVKASSTGIDDFFAGSAGQLNDGNWHHIAAVYDGTDKYLYIDGVLAATKNNPHQGAKLGTGTTRYGFIGDGSEANSFNGSRNNIYYEGQYDEIRFSETAFSADWIATEYENQNSPTTFSTVVFSSVALPVELSNFDVQRVGKGAEITWTTESEINNDYFTIEKSIDGVNYSRVDDVVGAGNSRAKLNYMYIDNAVLNGVSYYRLKQTDFDGKFEYFPPKSINNETVVSGSLVIKTVKPNPFTDRFTIEIESSGDAVVSLSITNINGKQEHLSQINIDEGVTEYVFDNGSGFLPGIYIVNLIKEGEKPVSMKIVKR